MPFLLSYCHFCVADYFFIQFISHLQAIYHLTFFVIAHAWNHCHGFVNIGIEVSIFCFYLAYALKLRDMKAMSKQQLADAAGVSVTTLMN